MNIPQLYLVEPYNAYAPKGKKKHWMQEVEEQALMARIIAEQTAIREAAAKQGNTPNVLPPQAPPTSQATPQAWSGGEGAAGGPNTNGGAGGAPRPQFFSPASSYAFTLTPATSSAPALVQFTVTGGEDIIALGGANVTWVFGDGLTGGGPSTSHWYTGTGSFDATMTVTSTKDGTTLATQTAEVTTSVPTVSSAFTITGATVTTGPGGYYTASINDALTFVNGASSNNPYNPLTYNWMFGSASLTSTATNPTFAYTVTGSYLVTLGVSGSFNALASGARKVWLTSSAP